MQPIQDAVQKHGATVPAAHDVEKPQRTWCLKVRACLKQQVPLFMVLTVMGLALLRPSLGAAFDNAIRTYLVVLLFVCTGFVIRSADLAKGASALHVHALIQFFSLLFTPFLYYFTVYRWHWASNSGMLSEQFDSGIMAAMLMPTTTTTNVLWTQLAGGEVSIAAVNAVVGNLLGAFIAPLLASVLVGGEAQKQDVGKKMLNMTYQIIVPFIGGLLLQLIVRRASMRIYQKLVPVGKHTLELIMCLMLYCMFCSAFKEGADGLSFGTIFVMILWVGFLHVVFVVLAWLCSWRFGMERRIAFVFTASQKTENMAVAILGQIFPAGGLYVLPIVTYHSIQMILASVLCGPLRRLAEQEAQRKIIAPELSPQDVLQQRAASRGTLLADAEQGLTKARASPEV